MCIVVIVIVALLYRNTKKIYIVAPLVCNGELQHSFFTAQYYPFLIEIQMHFPHYFLTITLPLTKSLIVVLYNKQTVILIFDLLTTTNVTEFRKITHMGANDTINISLLKAAFNFEFVPIYGCNKSLIPKITSRV